MTEQINFNIPIVGRFISGSMTEKRTKDWENKPIPEDKQRYEFGIAYDKQAFWAWLTNDFYPNTLSKALAGHQQALAQATAWFSNGFNGFSMKIDDGDTPNSRGQVNENAKGCFVVYFGSGMGIQAATGAQAPTEQIDIANVKRGYYVQMAGSIKFNEKSGTQMGIYMNATHVWLRAAGPEIVGSVDAATAFGGAQAAALPPGATQVDLSGGAAGAFGAPQMPQSMTSVVPPSAPAQQPMAPAASPAPGSMPPSAPGQTAYPGNVPAAPGQPPAGVQPYYGAMNPGQAPAAAQQQAAPAAPGLPQLPGLPGQ